MKIGIDISQIVYKGSGVGRFTLSLVESTLKYDKTNQYTFFFSSLRQKLDPNLEKKIKEHNHKLIKWPLPPTLLSFLWNDLHSISKLLTSNYSLLTDLDWFISSDWTEPPLSNINKATIVHDLVYLRYPQTQDEKIVKTQQKRMSWVKKESRLIFCDSQITKDDLITMLQIQKEKIIVNYPGVDITVPDQNQIKEALKKYGLDKPFILSVGKQEPRKNIDRLIQAFGKVNNKNIDLVIVGPKGWFSPITNNQYPIANIKFLGYISDEELYSLYASCLFFVYPSLWEGFGYPIAEAMKLGAPVACSNTSSMKEIGGEAALLFDPTNTEDMYRCINTLIQDENLRKELIHKGKNQAGKFEWENYIRILNKALYDHRN